MRGNSVRAGVRFGVTLQPLQIGFDLCRALVAQVAIFFESLVDDAFELDGQIGIEPKRRRGSAIQDAIEDHAGTFAMKRRDARGHFV